MSGAAVATAGPSPVAAPSPLPSSLPIALTAIEAQSAGISLAGYLGILLLLFLAIPFTIIIVRRYKIHNRFVWIRQRLLTRVPFDKLKSLMLTNAELSKRPFSQQLEAYLYSQTNWGYILDITQAFLSLVSVGLFIANSYTPIQSEQPMWSLVLEFLLTIYFACDWALRFYLAHDRLRFYFSALSLLDFITIVPGLLSIAVAENKFDAQAWVVASTLRVFRIFRVVRMMRVVTLAPGSSLQRQIGMLAVTVLSMVFAAAGIYQIVESTADRFMPFHKAMLYMTIIVIGRPPVPTDTTEAVIFVTIAIMVSASVIPAFVAELARLYFESQGHESYKSDPSQPHVIVCGDINTSRLKALLAQFFHKSRDAELVCPMVVLAEHKYEGPLRSLIEQSRYAGSVNYIRGSARRPADLKRAGLANASTVLVLCNRMMSDPNEADAEVVASCLAIKSVNRKLRVLAQLRRPRSADHLMVLPGWKEHDRTVALASLSMTLVGVGSVIPGLPTLLTNLIHQGNKSLARSAHPRRRQFTVRKGAMVPLNASGGAAGAGGALAAAGMLLAGQEKNWYTFPLAMVERMVEGFARMSYNLYLSAMPQTAEEDPNRPHHGASHRGRGGKHNNAITTDRALYAHIFKPLSPVEEYSMGFAQEMFAFSVTPGLAGRTFGAAARMAYLRYGVLLIGARIPVGMQLFTAGKSGAYNPNTAAAAAQAAANFAALNQQTVSGATGANLAAAAAAAAKGGNASSSAPGANGPTKVDPSDITYSVLLFPCDLILQPGMFIHAIAFDAIDLATMLQGTGGEAALRGSSAFAAAVAASGGPKNGNSVLSNANYYQTLNQNTVGTNGSGSGASGAMLASSPMKGSSSSNNLGAMSPPATPGAALHAGGAGSSSGHNDSTSLLHSSGSSNDLTHQPGSGLPALYDGALDVSGSGSLSFAAAAGRRHNRAAGYALSVPWCFCEQEEECSEMVVSLMDSHDTAQRSEFTITLPQQRRRSICCCLRFNLSVLSFLLPSFALQTTPSSEVSSPSCALEALSVALAHAARMSSGLRRAHVKPSRQQRNKQLSCKLHR
jgi:voltage-gated potassium channel